MKAPTLSRRRIVAGLAAAPASALAPQAATTAPDPHVAMVPDLLRAWRKHKETCFGWECDGRSPEAKAAEDAYGSLTSVCLHVAELPAPKTIEGLKALAMAIGIMSEFYLPEDADPWETAFATIVEAILVSTGQTMPADWQGMRNRREDAPCA